MELSAAPTATPLMEEPQSARTPKQAERPQSQSRAVPSLEADTTFLPRSTIAVSKIPKKRGGKTPEMEEIVQEVQVKRGWCYTNDFTEEWVSGTAVKVCSGA